jgi:hypothetical protein
VVVSPLVRLTNKAGAKIEDIGPPEGILTSLGAFITGAPRRRCATRALRG